MVTFAQLDPRIEDARREALTPPARGKGSKVGHIVTIHFGKQQQDYTVIAEYKNRKAATVYLLSEWNTASNKLIEIYSDGYQITEGRAVFTESTLWLDYKEQAMRNVWRLIELLKRIRLALREVGVGSVEIAQIGAFTAQRGRFEMEDKTGYFSHMSEGEFYFGDKTEATRLCEMRRRANKRLKAEMQKAGIV